MYIKFDKGYKYSSAKTIDSELSEDLEAFDDAGYVLTENDLVVDIDDLDKKSIEALIKDFDIGTQIVWTDRGAHLYFKRPNGFNRARGVTALGLKVEYKTSNNTRATTIKRNGKERDVLNKGCRETLPDFLVPNRKYHSLLGMDEGDGRNDALYKHKRLIAHLEDHNRILRFINQHILASPLDEKEFQTLSREEEILGGKDRENIVADMIMRDYSTVLYNGHVYFYDRNHYITNEDILKRKVWEYCPNEKTRYVNEVKDQIEGRCELVDSEKVFKVKFKNGYLDEGEFVPMDYIDFTPYYIDIDYDPNAKPVEIVDEYLDNLSGYDEDYKQFILEIFGHCLITDPEVKRAIAKFFIFVGNGGEGKGTFLQIVEKILGKDNVCKLSISEMTNESYFTNIEGKLANLGDDIQNEPITGKQMRKLKNVSTADSITLRALYENARPAQPIATLIFTSNNILKSFDKDESYKRRVVWCPMFSKPKKAEFNFITKVTTPEALSYWIRLAVEAYQRLYERGNIKIPKVVEEYNTEYHLQNNNTIEFASELTDKEIDGMRLKEIYETYEAWCTENSYSPLSKKELRKSIEELKGYIFKPYRNPNINGGKTTRVFVKKES